MCSHGWRESEVQDTKGVYISRKSNMDRQKKKGRQ